MDTSEPNNLVDHEEWLAIEHLKEREATNDDFYFEYLAPSGRLRSVFWADEISRISYKKFNDIVSVDAFYNTNNKKMVFISFSGIGNHKNPITLGAALILTETRDMYRWVLEAFLNAHSTQPVVVITQYFPLLQDVLSLSFSESVLMMPTWEILRRIPNHVPAKVMVDLSFRQEIKKIVLNLDSDDVLFVNEWHELVHKFGLVDNLWINSIVSQRRMWVPALIKYVPMSYVMQSMPSAAMVDLNPRNSVLQLIRSHDTKLVLERFQYLDADIITRTAVFRAVTSHPIEKHAFSFYTTEVFEAVRKEIVKSITRCQFVTSIEAMDDDIISVVRQNDRSGALKQVYQVCVNNEGDYVSCTCLGFERFGYLCRHALCVYGNTRVSKIPPMYLLPRWKRRIMPMAYLVDNQQAEDFERIQVQQAVLLQQMNDGAPPIILPRVDEPALVFDMEEID